MDILNGEWTVSGWNGDPDASGTSRVTSRHPADVKIVRPSRQALPQCFANKRIGVPLVRTMSFLVLELDGKPFFSWPIPNREMIRLGTPIHIGPGLLFEATLT